MSKPELYISIDNAPEFNVQDKIPELNFLGEKSQPVLSNGYQDGLGFDGSVFTTATYDRRISEMRFFMHVTDYYDKKNLSQQVYDLLMQKKLYRIRTEADPMMVRFLRPTGFDIPGISEGSKDNVITVQFENPTGYKFSRYDSQNQFDLWDDYPLGWNYPIVTADDYHFIDRPTIKVLNPSGIPIDPYTQHHQLQIEMVFTGNAISLHNRTNGSNYSYTNYNGSAMQSVTLNGLESYQGSHQANSNSNFGNIKLEPGFNEITVGGCNHYDLKFKFPFLFI